MGLLSAANAAGQLIFLPLLAVLAERYGWEGVAIAVTLAIAAVIPVQFVVVRGAAFVSSRVLMGGNAPPLGQSFRAV